MHRHEKFIHIMNCDLFELINSNTFKLIRGVNPDRRIATGRVPLYLSTFYDDLLSCWSYRQVSTIRSPVIQLLYYSSAWTGGSGCTNKHHHNYVVREISSYSCELRRKSNIHNRGLLHKRQPWSWIFSTLLGLKRIRVQGMGHERIGQQRIDDLVTHATARVQFSSICRGS